MRICEVSEMKRRAMALSSQLDDAYARLGTGELDGVAAVGAESYIAPSAMLCEGSIVGEQCYIGEGALVSDAVVLDGAHVAPGEFVLSVVRGPNGKIEI